jgi:hypothetical protein
MDKVTILKAVMDNFPGCRIQVQDLLIWVYRGSVVLHILNINVLTYYFETNQLNNYLKEL